MFGKVGSPLAPPAPWLPWLWIFVARPHIDWMAPFDGRQLLVCVRVLGMCSDQLDSIAQKKLVNFVHDLMTQYFDFVCRRVQLEVLPSFFLYLLSYQLLWPRSVENAVNRMTKYRKLDDQLAGSCDDVF